MRAIDDSGSAMSSPRPRSLVDDGSAASRLGWILGALGLGALVASFALSPEDARSAAAQDWSPFVLVTGLLLIGLVANRDGLFAAAGHQLARSAPSGPLLFIGATAVIAIVTALLNLDTSVAFLTPTLLYAARSRRGGEAPLLYGCLLLSNAGSLFLPGANLTNLIVLGHFHVSGLEFLSHMWAPALATLVVTAAVVAVMERKSLRLGSAARGNIERPTLGIGAAAVAASTLCVLVLDSPAIAVAIIGVTAIALRIATGREHVRRALDVVGLPTLIGLFGWPPPSGPWVGCGPDPPYCSRSRHLGHRSPRRGQFGAGEQPARGQPAGCPDPSPPLRLVDRPQRRAKSLGHRGAVVADLVAQCPGRRRPPVTGPGQSHRRRRRPAFNGLRLGPAAR